MHGNAGPGRRAVCGQNRNHHPTGDGILRMLPLATQVTEAQLEKLLSDFVSNMEPDNETMQALQKSLRSDTPRKALQVLGFSSETKYSAVSYGGQESYVLGAAGVYFGC